MKVIQESSSQMTLRLRPWFLWLFGAIFSSAGLSAPILGSQVNTFSCHRDNIAPATCQSSSKSLFWSKHQVLTLENIQGTKIHTFTDSKGNYRYRLFLLTNEGEASPILKDVRRQTTVTNWVQEIELFLKETERQNLLIEDDNRLFMGLFGGLFVFVGLAVAVVMGKVVVCDIDKTLGQLTLAQYGIIGNSQTEYRTCDIRAVTLQKAVSSKGDSTYRLALVMHSGEYIPFTSYYSSGFRQQQKTSDIISQFLNLQSLPENDHVMLLKEGFSKFKNVANLGLMNQQQREDQIAHLQQAVINNRHDAEANYQYGFALYVLQRHQEAQPFLAEGKRLFGLAGEQEKVQYIDSLLQSLN
ncbi:tetratricopeptide repeat protein [Nodularia chucula]|uniref:tetratricopeptide repeat protein n=1 Tax=Nodularia chucula TaxID=3093667 RepID=UPI0039C6A79C